MPNAVAAVGADEVVTLRRLALEGALVGETKVSCSGLAEVLDVSTQTISRRLRQLEDAGLIERDTVSDGQWIRLTDAGERTLREEYRAYRRVFEGAETVTLRGSVTGGMGEGRHYISLPGYMEQFRERLGYEPFAGTLNIDLDADSVRARAGLAALDPVRIDGWEDEDRTYGPAFCYPATIAAGDGPEYEPAHVIAPERTHHGEDQLEVIAPEKLRTSLGLADEDTVVVRVTAPTTEGGA